MNNGLYELLASSLSARMPLHMPGHKRNELLAPYLSGLGARLDVTEIEGFDNLHDPHGILQEGMSIASELWRAHKSFYLVNGSTGGILAGLRALSRPGDRVIMQRDCHMSVYQGVGLLGLRPAYLYPEMIEEYGIPSSVRVDQLSLCLSEHPDARLLVLSCPSYEGILSDLHALVSLAHGKGLKVLVDAAHGAHLGLDSRFPDGAVSSGADIVIHSLHKTLPSLTQTAMAHAGNEGAASLLQEQLDVFQTSSPSYLLMASIDGCVRLLKEKREELFERWKERLTAFADQAQSLKHFDILGMDSLPDTVFGHDPGKLLIGCERSGISGYRLLGILRESFGIDLEMAGDRIALAMTGMGDERNALSRLANALEDIEKRLEPKQILPLASLPRAEAVMIPAQALEAPFELLPTDAASGRVCAEYVTAYPPGIPLLTPGEVIAPDMIRAVTSAGNLIKSRSKGKTGHIAVLKASQRLMSEL